MTERNFADDFSREKEEQEAQRCSRNKLFRLVVVVASTQLGAGNKYTKSSFSLSLAVNARE